MCPRQGRVQARCCNKGGRWLEVSKSKASETEVREGWVKRRSNEGETGSKGPTCERGGVLRRTMGEVQDD
jgi:hypothetical protein